MKCSRTLKYSTSEFYNARLDYTARFVMTLAIIEGRPGAFNLRNLNRRSYAYVVSIR